MAGDWIKVETATPDKPEVLKLARALKVEPAHAFGLLLIFWIWFDRNSRNGVVTQCSPEVVDTVVRTVNFAASMHDIRWLKIDNDGALTIPNAERHNGKTAKTRALTRDRVKRMRDALVTTPLRKSNVGVTQHASPEKRSTINPGLITITENKEKVNTKGTMSPEKQTAGPWWITADDIDRKAREEGVEAIAGESYKALKARVFTAIAERERRSG
ncbi:MAG: hypothetical protein ACREDY_06480 [Bradyrhizobium sp.]